VVTTDDRLLRDARQNVQRKWMGAYAPSRHIDPLLVLAALVLSGIGLLFIYSATFHRLPEGNEFALVQRQVLSLLIGVVLMVVTAVVDYRIFRVWSPAAYLGTIGLLAYVLTQPEIKGSTSWIIVGGFQFQPSEFAKVALILVLAALFHERREEALGLRALVEGVALAAVPMGLILLQPDFGTFMVFVAIVFVVLLLARVKVRYLAMLVLLGVLAIGGAWQLELVKDYQIERLTTFLDPEAADAQSSYWNVAQAQIAVGSGQIVGQGLFRGSQAALGYVPENHTDFIFTVVGEESGFIGSLVLLSAYGLLVARGLRIAAMSRDTFGTLLAGGIVGVFVFQLLINVGMNIGIMPVSGLPLPFVSYGGTSLMVSLAMVGLLQNVHMRRFQTGATR
jgi:rod shape determining protein RodA